MTHDELLSKIEKSYYSDSTTGLENALRAVVELHKPEHSISGYRCTICFTATTYPCPTIQAIEKELA